MPLRYLVRDMPLVTFAMWKSLRNLISGIYLELAEMAVREVRVGCLRVILASFWQVS